MSNFITVLASLKVQWATVGLAALAAGLFGGLWMGVAVASGGVASIVNTGLLWWRWRRGAQDYHCDAGRHLRSFYRSSLERFFVVVMLLAAGFYWIGDHPVALLAGFLVGQMAWMLASLTLRERT